MAGSRGPLALAITVAVLCGLTATALAQDVPTVPDTPTNPPTGDRALDPNPCSAANDTSGQESCDTEYTPTAKDGSALWRQVGGAVFGDNGDLAQGSYTPYTVDFYAVDFLDERHGFAGGAACPEDTPFEDLGSCDRVPVIWAYTDRDGEGPLWREVYRGEDPGFVGAISYYARDKALAVGGTGLYPYREFSDDSTTDPDHDPSGKGAAWDLHVNQSGEIRWSPYEADELPGAPNLRAAVPDPVEAATNHHAVDGEPYQAPMRALTALDCRHDVGRPDRCVAGGLQQFFLWEEGSFNRSYGNGSPDYDCIPSPAPCQGVSPATQKLPPQVGGEVSTPPVDANNNPGTELHRAVDLRFRIRALRFVPGENPNVKVVGVTSGCCDPNPANDVARMLMFHDNRWKVRPLYESAVLNDHERQTLPDSYYALEAYGGGTTTDLSVVAAQGGPEDQVEPASLVLGRIRVDGGTNLTAFISDVIGAVAPSAGGEDTDLLREALAPNLSDMRLVAGEGDVGSPERPLADTNTGGGPDHFMDWAVGERRTTGQGLAYTTLVTPHGPHAPSPANCGEPITAGTARTIDPAKCQPASQDQIQERVKSSALYLLDSYRLNGFTVAGTSGTGWAVGDKGAIEQLGGTSSSGQLGDEPPPPRLGAHAPSPDPGTSAYGSAPGLTDDPGSVPALNGRTESRSAPTLVQTGSPNVVRAASLKWDDAATVVASRDGGEAWALGAARYPAYAGQNTTLWHFDGSDWTTCDADGVEDQVAADPACASLSPLLHYTNDNRQFAPVSITAATRVPLEYDSDPSNDDEFEVVALGKRYRAPGTTAERNAVLRYRDGRWSVDTQAMAQLDASSVTLEDIVFTAPDDGWALDYFYGRLYHFDGESWHACEGSAENQGGCGDDPSAPRLPPATGPYEKTLHLASAGRRLYMYGGRSASSGQSPNSPQYPLIIYKDPGGRWTDGSGAGESGGGLDPGCGSHDPQTHACVAADDAETIRLDAFSVAQNADGSFSGWASGLESTSSVTSDAGVDLGARGVLFQLAEHDERYSWQLWGADDAVSDYAENLYGGSAESPELLTLPAADGPGRAFLAPTVTGAFRGGGPLLTFDPERARWVPYPTPFIADENSTQGKSTVGQFRTVAPDGRGGAWFPVRRLGGKAGFSTRLKQGAIFFYRYTNQVPREVFSDVPNPVPAQQVITGTATGGDGSFWVSTRSGSAYRYDRRTGWQRINIPGWDPGRVVTRPSHANAVAVGPDGSGVVVGEGGRIADVGPTGGALDAAAGVSCAEHSSPCGTGRDLFAAAVAPDGSALVGGDARVLLWRPPGGDFQLATSPPANLTATITSISMPTANRAWLTTDTGQVFSGAGSGPGWSWRQENLSPDGTSLSTGTQGNSGSSGETVSLNAIAVDANGFGFAVGDQGLVLQRTGDAAHPWKRLGDLPLSDYTSVSVPPSGGLDGALVGGEYGLILTLDRGRLEVAHQQDPWDPINATQTDTGPSHVVGLGLVPGAEAGQLEAWAAEQAPADSVDRKGGNLGTNRTPAPNALLHFSTDPDDPMLDGGAGRAAPLPDSPLPPEGTIDLAAFGKSDCEPVEGSSPCPAPLGSQTFTDEVTGEIADRLTGTDAPDLAISTGDSVDAAGTGNEHDTVTGRNEPLPANPVDPSVMHRRWVDYVAGPIAGGGVPLVGALGRQDLSRTSSGQPGSPIPWEKALSGMSEPWGRGSDLNGSDGLSFVPVGGTGVAGSEPDPGQASTHYAFDIVRDEERLVRVAVLDTSLKSVTAGDALQNPADDQTNWLRSVLCRPGDATGVGSNCTRGADERAVVVSEAPTYTYGPAASETLLATDSASLEALLFEYGVDLVVSGRLGWNGLYYSRDAGVHSPQPGEPYPQSPPDPIRPDGHVITNVVASGAGGTFAAEGAGSGASSGADGYWHGYSVMHLDPATGAVTVEQRPVLDWLRISAPTHTIRAGKKLALYADGREPPGTDQPLRYDQISSPAITHRFELLQADPARPWLPLHDQGSSDDSTEPRSAASTRLEEGDPCGPYLCVPSNVGTVDDQSGEVKAGKGAYPRTFAIAALSVGKHSATYPLVFEPRASFRTQPPAPAAPVAVPPPAPAPAPPNPTTPQVNLPAAPVIPVLTAQALAPPPLPPSPPTFASQAPLDLNLAPASLDVTPPTAVSQPPTPPVNPAPPSGARREARQRQAAAQKSGADSDQEGSEAQELGGDAVQGPDQAHGSAATRRENAFTAISNREQPSAWARNALLGGGLGIAALILALGVTGRPTPRRREPEQPAPAFARTRRR